MICWGTTMKLSKMTTENHVGGIQAEDLTDKTFGWLTAKEQVPKPEHISGKRRGAWWRCECRCGSNHIASAYNLKQGNVKSCGCMARDKVAKARAGKTRAKNLKNKNCTNFKTPGGSNAILSMGGLTVECKCYTCKKKFDKLSADWSYKAVVDGRLRFFCTWKCYRMATNKPKKAHGNSLAARAAEG